MKLGKPFPHDELRPMVAAISREYFCPGYTPRDLEQEAWVGAVTAVRDYRPGVGTLHGFVRMCVRRQLIDVIIVAHRSRQRVLNEAHSGEALELAWRDTFDATIGARETLRELAEARRHLTVVERAAFDNYVNGRTLVSKRDENARYRALAKLRAAA